jgi:hypothetical protein
MHECPLLKSYSPSLLLSTLDSVDYSVSCTSSRYAFGVVWAAAMVVVYPVGLPVCGDLWLMFLWSFYLLTFAFQMFFLFALYLNRHIISRQDREATLASYEYTRDSKASSWIHDPTALLFLYQDYEPQYWYWEIVETYRRLLLSAVAAIVSDDVGVQVDCPV